MTIGIEVGSSVVSVVPSLEGFYRHVATESRAIMPRIGRELASDLTASVRQAMRTQRAIDLRVDVDTRQVVSEVRQAVRQATAALPAVDLRVDLDATQIAAEARRAVTAGGAMAPSVRIDAFIDDIQFVGGKGDTASIPASESAPAANPFQDLKSADDISSGIDEVTFDDDDIPF